MVPERHLAFLGTSRSGLGHVRRIANIARQIVRRDAGVRLTLISNEEPAGLGWDDLAPFQDVVISDTGEMVRHISEMNVSLAVVDTMSLPGIGEFGGGTALIMRETPPDRVMRLRRDDGRPWDIVLIPNTAGHWAPDLPEGFARKVSPVGWVRRSVGCRAEGERSAGIVLATGGGGTAETRAVLYPVLTELVARARSLSGTEFRIRQALGPRAAGAVLPGVDEVFDPGAALDRVFRAADLVISTAGYNSVLELAGTDTPALLVPIPRSLDDQTARVALWGPRLGFGLLPDRLEAAAIWLADQVDRPRRRAPHDLGPDGAARAADVLLEMLCPVS